MGNRKQPFGYQMLNGEIALHPQEADTVRTIFKAYSEGAGFAALAEMLNESSVPYYPGKSWNKNIIARLLEDARYTGEKGFPPIIDREQLDAVDAQRKSRSVPPKVSPSQKTLRCFCGFRPTEELEYQVLWQMNRIIAEPDLLCCPTTEKQSALSLTLEKELDKLLDEQPVDETAAKTRIFQIAAARYGELDDNKYETERLRTIFSEMNPLNELDADLLTMLSAFSQAESESTSGRVRWGIQESMREGKANIRYNHFYGYEKGDDERPRVVPVQAEVVRQIFENYLAGDSIHAIKEKLEARGIPNAAGKATWTASTIKGILTNEKYCGDVLRQKTFTSDCISRKVIRNTGQREMYLIQNHHEGIVTRETFDAVQAEMARRTAGKSPSSKNITGQAKYSGKYALTERLICGECGTLYRRCTWTAQGRRRIVWRCVSRLDYGKKYCHNSPTVYEDSLHEAILNAVNRTMSGKKELLGTLQSAMEYELAPVPGAAMSIAEIDRRMEKLTEETNRILEISASEGSYDAYTDRLKEIVDELASLKEQRREIETRRKFNRQTEVRLNNASTATGGMSPAVTEWEESMIRQLIDTVKVMSADRIKIYFRGGLEVEQELNR